jgi:hypothetical protein
MGRALKVTIWAGIVFGAWKLLHAESFYNAILQFGAAGVVPGTDIILSPQQVMWVMAAFLWICAMLIFWREVKRELWRLRQAWHRRGHKTSIIAPVQEKVIAKPALVRVSTPKQPKKSTPPAVIITIPRKPGRLLQAYRMLRPQIIVMSTRARVWLYRTVRILLARTDAYVRRAAAAVVHTVKLIWRWTEPRIRRLDRRIEMTLKRNKDIAAILHAGSESVRIANTWLSTARDRLNRALEK